MASIFGHALTAVAFGKTFSKEITTSKFWILGILCSVIPDADVVGFKFGIAYESFWGHRGFSHSLLFSLLLGIIVVLIFYNKQFTSKIGMALVLYFTLCTASHAILDAMTTGGLGVAFFSPFNDSRYFFSWRPIKVSPIGASKFFSIWGVRVIQSELIWIGIPCFFYMMITRFFRRKQITHSNLD